ncbi:Seed maturation protein [Canna indica]|uniref:Seed maturation protein n=1 Tax=Canna indica TaxID=4628 RepID=A0AAQ3JKQ5_9LILI|nr:Seed maturation protein [Canna indica]
MSKQEATTRSATSRKVTIGDALEATLATDGDKSVDASDATTIQAVEAVAIGMNAVMPGGVAAVAQAAALANASMNRDEDTTKLCEVVADMGSRLPVDKEATREDAERVVATEMRNNSEMRTHSGGIGA